jgi:hypothetical protein
MEFFSYVMVLASVIVGLAVTHLLQGVAKMIQHPDRPKLYWVHILWVLLLFLNALLLWWWEFELSSARQWTFELYLFVMGFSVVLYMLCAILMPDHLGHYGTYRAYFFSRRRWFLGLMLFFGLMDVVDSAVKGWDHFLSLGWPYFAFVASRPVLLIAGMQSRNAKLHAAIPIIFLGELLVMAFRSFHTIQ